MLNVFFFFFTEISKGTNNKLKEARVIEATNAEKSEKSKAKKNKKNNAQLCYCQRHGSLEEVRTAICVSM